MSITEENVVDFIKSMLTQEKEESEQTMIVSVKPELSFPVNRDRLTNCVRQEFIEAFEQIPRIRENLSYKQLVGHSALNMLEGEVLALLAIGKALGVWKLFPQDFSKDKTDSLFQKDPYGVLPMIVGFGEEVCMTEHQ